MKIMFDSNVFDEIYNSTEALERIVSLKENEYYITSIQKSELESISDETKKQALLSICIVVAQIMPTSAVVGFSRVGDCVVVDEDDVYSELLNATHSNVKDAMIGSAAKREGCTVITNDVRFSKRLKKCQIPTMAYADFMNNVLED